MYIRLEGPECNWSGEREGVIEGDQKRDIRARRAMRRNEYGNIHVTHQHKTAL